MPRAVRGSKSPIEDAKSITSTLRRSNRVMAATVSTADQAVSSLAQDGDVIEDTLDTHKRGLKNELKETKTALRKVKIAASREKWMIWGSLGFFTTVVVYIITKRTRIMALLWLLATGAYHGGNILNDLYREGQRGISEAQSDLGEGVDTLVQHLTQEPMKIERAETPSLGEARQGWKEELETTMEGYLDMDIDINNYEIPMPPRQYGPLTQEDHEVAAMYDKFLKE